MKQAIMLTRLGSRPSRLKAGSSPSHGDNREDDAGDLIGSPIEFLTTRVQSRETVPSMPVRRDIITSKTSRNRTLTSYRDRLR